MVRKRPPNVRYRDRFRRRRRAAPPKEGWLLSELASLAGVSTRTIRYYVEKELLPRPAFYGTATRYRRPVLLRLLAIQRMQRDEHLRLEAIKRRLAHMSAEEVEAYAVEKLTSAPAAIALGVAQPPPATGAVLGEPEVMPRYASERWELVRLLPGLSLFVEADASPLVRKLAQQIYDHCVGAAQAQGVP